MLSPRKASSQARLVEQRSWVSASVSQPASWPPGSSVTLAGVPPNGVFASGPFQTVPSDMGLQVSVFAGTFLCLPSSYLQVPGIRGTSHSYFL